MKTIRDISDIHNFKNAIAVALGNHRINVKSDIEIKQPYDVKWVVWMWREIDRRDDLLLGALLMGLDPGICDELYFLRRLSMTMEETQ